MSDQLGNITVPEIAVSGTFPIVSDYPFGRSNHPDVAIHQFGSGNAKIEQRFLLARIAGLPAHGSLRADFEERSVLA